MKDDGSADARTAVRAMVGTRLRHLRLARNITLETAAEALTISVPTLSRMERGQAPLKPGALVGMLTLYGVTDPLQQDVLISVAIGGRQPGWWFGDAVPLEESVLWATEQASELIRTYQPFHVPELLRTEEYARAAHLARHYPSPPSDATDAAVKNLLCRQAALTARLWAVIDEPILWRPVGDLDAHLRQLDALASASRERIVTIQILPWNAPFSPHSAPFTIFSPPASDKPQVLAVHRYTGDEVTDLRSAEHYGLLFDQLIGVALSRTETAQIIARIRDRLRAQPSGDPL